MTRRVVGIETMRVLSPPAVLAAKAQSQALGGGVLHEATEEATSAADAPSPAGGGCRATAVDDNNDHRQEYPPKLLHRAWSALPVGGDGGLWHHSLEPSQLD